MTYLVDANVILSVLLDEEHAEDGAEFLERVPRYHLCISEFSFYSVALSLIKRGTTARFVEFIDDVEAGVSVLGLSLSDLRNLTAIMQQYTLDFDDAFQYTVAENHNLTIVSYDTDFNRTPRRAVTPAMVLRRLEQSSTDQENDTK